MIAAFTLLSIIGILGSLHYHGKEIRRLKLRLDALEKEREK